MKKSTTKLLRHGKLALNAETIVALTAPQLGHVVGGSVDHCQGFSYARGVCPPSPDTGEEEA